MSEVIGEWLLNYIPEEGGRFTGRLEVGADKVKFVSLYESSNKTIVKAIFVDLAVFAASGGKLIYRYFTKDEAVVELPTDEIASVEAAKKGLMKRAVVTMKNGEVFVFDYGLLSVTKLVEAIQSVLPR